MERRVNIHADGRLVYTGILPLAARRLEMDERVLTIYLDKGPLDVRTKQPRGNIVDGVYYPIPKARTYVARWRD
jgi:hypothetical protein